LLCLIVATGWYDELMALELDGTAAAGHLPSGHCYPPGGGPQVARDALDVMDACLERAAATYSGYLVGGWGGGAGMKFILLKYCLPAGLGGLIRGTELLVTPEPMHVLLLCCRVTAVRWTVLTWWQCSAAPVLRWDGCCHAGG
jgi:hypothetical protein